MNNEEIKTIIEKTLASGEKLYSVSNSRICPDALFIITKRKDTNYKYKVGGFDLKRRELYPEYIACDSQMAANAALGKIMSTLNFFS